MKPTGHCVQARAMPGPKGVPAQDSVLSPLHCSFVCSMGAAVHCNPLEELLQELWGCGSVARVARLFKRAAVEACK